MDTKLNNPGLWIDLLPRFKPEAHKYDRGLAVIYGAPAMTGATRLAAAACARIGAGLVKVIAPEGTGEIYRTTLPAHIIVEDENSSSFAIDDPRCRSVLMGPGCLPDTKRFGPVFYKVMDQHHVHVHGLILDAGAFVALAENIMEFKAISHEQSVVVTPHEGEFRKIFSRSPDVFAGEDKKNWARSANLALDATVVLKGARTVVAGEGDDIVVNDRPLPELATAGTGDVLAGMITGLMAQGMPAKPASCAAVWIHAEAAARFGKGFVASDLPDLIPAVLQDISR